jgi:DNA polymerase III alpha subunit
LHLPPTGIYETVLFPRVYNRFCHMLKEMRPYLLKGKVEKVNGIDFLDEYKRKAQVFQKQRNRAGKGCDAKP